MIIGILYEGTYDYETIKSIVIQFLKELNINKDIKIVPYECHGGIFGKKEDAATLFFENDPACDIAIYLNDMDKKTERCKDLKKFAATYKKKNVLANIIVVCPKPTLEEWFFIEEKAIKKLFNLDMSKPIERKGADSKKHLQNLIYKYSDITVDMKVIYKQLGELLDASVLVFRDPAFADFHNKFIKVIKSST